MANEFKTEIIDTASIVSKFVLDTRFHELPEKVITMAKRCLLDFLGVAISSNELPAVKSGFGLLEALGNSEEATIIGCNQSTSVIGAVWANSMLGSAMDLEDGYYPSVGHPASVIFPVTMAIAESKKKTAKDFLKASIIGYEVCARSGMLMTGSYREKPRGSGASSVYGAAAAAASLLGLEKKKIEMALGIAGSYMTSIPVLKSHAHEAMIKGGIPWGSLVGTVAAILAQHGFTGPSATLQDPFCSEYDDTAISVLQSLGQEYEILEVYFKRYPSCRWTHAALEATATILKKHDLDINHISSIDVETFKEATALNLRRPSSLEGVQFSIPFTLALLLSEGDFGVKQMSLDYLKNHKVQNLADKVHLKVDKNLNKLFPKQRPAKVTIQTDQGQIFSNEIIEVHGEPGSDFAINGVKAKFMDLVSKRFGTFRSDEIYKMVFDLENHSTLKPLISQLKG